MVNGGWPGYMGWGVRRPKYFTTDYRSTRSLQRNMRMCQGILREKIVPECGDPFRVPSRTVLWCMNGVVRAAISIPHL